MQHNHNRDLSIGGYILVGSHALGLELFGLSTTLRISLCIVGLGLAASLIAAGIQHLRRSYRRKKESRDWARRLRLAMSQPEQVGRQDERYLNARLT
jgi:hypothetical protein